ncbi:hypothetical protein QQF64_034387 [Cirrhinus molitorella]|uniref:Uncharacterized protein n=1 Tax=Cirrhinus molitorella TaxID=172907 RepID=A0ABR3L1K6_9TELE
MPLIRGEIRKKPTRGRGDLNGTLPPKAESYPRKRPARLPAGPPLPSSFGLGEDSASFCMRELAQMVERSLSMREVAGSYAAFSKRVPAQSQSLPEPDGSAPFKDRQRISRLRFAAAKANSSLFVLHLPQERHAGPPRFELGSLDSKSRVLPIYTRAPRRLSALTGRQIALRLRGIVRARGWIPVSLATGHARPKDKRSPEAQSAGVYGDTTRHSERRQRRATRAQKSWPGKSYRTKPDHGLVRDLNRDLSHPSENHTPRPTSQLALPGAAACPRALRFDVTGREHPEFRACGKEKRPQRISRLRFAGSKSKLSLLFCTCRKRHAGPPRFELGSLDSKSRVLTITPGHHDRLSAADREADSAALAGDLLERGVGSQSSLALATLDQKTKEAASSEAQSAGVYGTPPVTLRDEQRRATEHKRAGLTAHDPNQGKATRTKPDHGLVRDLNPGPLATQSENHTPSPNEPARSAWPPLPASSIAGEVSRPSAGEIAQRVERRLAARGSGIDARIPQACSPLQSLPDQTDCAF